MFTDGRTDDWRHNASAAYCSCRHRNLTQFYSWELGSEVSCKNRNTRLTYWRHPVLHSMTWTLLLSYETLTVILTITKYTCRTLTTIRTTTQSTVANHDHCIAQSSWVNKWVKGQKFSRSSLDKESFVDQCLLGKIPSSHALTQAANNHLHDRNYIDTHSHSSLQISFPSRHVPTELPSHPHPSLQKCYSIKTVPAKLLTH